MKFLPITEERHVSDAIITALAEGGVRYVLGMPGGLDRTAVAVPASPPDHPGHTGSRRSQSVP